MTLNPRDLIPELVVLAEVKDHQTETDGLLAGIVLGTDEAFGGDVLIHHLLIGPSDQKLKLLSFDGYWVLCAEVERHNFPVLADLPIETSLDELRIKGLRPGYGSVPIYHMWEGETTLLVDGKETVVRRVDYCNHRKPNGLGDLDIKSIGTWRVYILFFPDGTVKILVGKFITEPTLH